MTRTEQSPIVRVRARIKRLRPSKAAILCPRHRWRNCWSVSSPVTGAVHFVAPWLSRPSADHTPISLLSGFLFPTHPLPGLAKSIRATLSQGRVHRLGYSRPDVARKIRGHYRYHHFYLPYALGYNLEAELTVDANSHAPAASRRFHRRMLAPEGLTNRKDSLTPCMLPRTLACCHYHSAARTTHLLTHSFA